MVTISGLQMVLALLTHTQSLYAGGCLMLLNQLRAQRNQIVDLEKLHGASHVRVFGSVAKGEETESSDIDFLVTLPRGYDMFQQRIPFDDALAELLNRNIDLIPEHELNRHLRDHVIAEAVSL